MLRFPDFNPIAFNVGPIAVHWYGLMYLAGFAMAFALGRRRVAQGKAPISAQDLEDLLFYTVLGVVLGGRLGYVLFYQPAFYFTHPLQIFYVWDGGMSFHGGLLGVILIMLIFAHKRGITFFQLSDFMAPLIPPALGAGRLGNFINGELWGRPSTLPWAMVFPGSHDGVARHPSQLYELGLEGIVLFIVLWRFSSKPRKVAQTSALFLILYGLFRFLVEFTREPDSFLGLLALGLSMGQWLSMPMILGGLALFIVATKRPFRSLPGKLSSSPTQAAPTAKH